MFKESAGTSEERNDNHQHTHEYDDVETPVDHRDAEAVDYI